MEPENTVETKKPSRRENKKRVRASMIAAFGDAVETKDICTGTVTYTVIRPKGQSFNIAAIYGSKTAGGQSLWVKEAVWSNIDKELRDATHSVDVALFNRGWQWAIHTGDENDEIITAAAESALTWGAAELARKEERTAKKAERAAKRLARESAMAAKRAEFRAKREKNSDE
jgi:hypothetical protein